jgi:2',3'-cyclic-nucleotide 2'-phosphodiesterase/3'-nucleotidase
MVAALKAKEHPDLVIGAIHGGLDRDLKTGVVPRGETKNENPIFQIATSVPSLDAIVFGHSHRDLPGAEIGGVLVVQPKNWGVSLARIDFVLEREGNAWKLISRRSRLIPVTEQTVADEEILRLAKPYHELTERYLNTPVAESPIEMEGTLARIQDSVLLDAVQRVQLFYSKADVSFTALFNPRVRIPQGPMTVRQIAALYIYDNELYAIQGTGKMVRAALENAARYFKSCATPACSEPSLINREFAAFNFDIAEGVDYDINLLKPEGQRITKLNYRGQPLADTQKLRIAINNYRAAGSAGYSMFQDAPILWRSPAEIRDLIIEYYTRERVLPAKADNNWRIIPESARTALEREARAEAARAGTQ